MEPGKSQIERERCLLSLASTCLLQTDSPLLFSLSVCLLLTFPTGLHEQPFVYIRRERERLRLRLRLRLRFIRSSFMPWPRRNQGKKHETHDIIQGLLEVSPVLKEVS